MALRTGTKADLVSGLHAGPVRLGVDGLADPSGNDFIVMNYAAVAPGGIVNALTIATGATGTGVTLSVGGNNADANRSITVVGAGTGATIVGSSVSPVTLAGAPSVSSNLTVTGTVNASTVNSSGVVQAQVNTASSAAVAGLKIGSSGPTIYFGSSAPTIACKTGDIMLNTGGSSVTVFNVCMPNGGTASSSNWDSYTPI
jgi:hypothetical protein